MPRSAEEDWDWRHNITPQPHPQWPSFSNSVVTGGHDVRQDFVP